MNDMFEQYMTHDVFSTDDSSHNDVDSDWKMNLEVMGKELYS